MGDVPTLNGVMIVGIADGVQGGDFPRYVVKCPDANGQLWSRQIEVRGFNPVSGEPTDVGLEFQKVKVGDRIAVGVFVNVKKGNYARTTDKHQQGDEFLMPEFVAQWVQVLGAMPAKHAA